jgi:hypothetical protein
LADERRRKRLAAIIGVLSVMLFFTFVVTFFASLTFAGTESAWRYLALVATLSFFVLVMVALPILSIVEPPARNGDRQPKGRPLRPWHWLLVPAWGLTLGVTLGFADDNRGFWRSFLIGFVLGASTPAVILTMNVAGPAFRRFADRFVKPS